MFDDSFKISKLAWGPGDRCMRKHTKGRFQSMPIEDRGMTGKDSLEVCLWRTEVLQGRAG